jgi:ribosomal 50S subunit-recycling heat shock protein
MTDPSAPQNRRMRLDQALVERGLCASREKAQRAVMAGQVRVNGQVAHKSSESVSFQDQIASARQPAVSRIACFNVAQPRCMRSTSARANWPGSYGRTREWW